MPLKSRLGIFLGVMFLLLNTSSCSTVTPEKKVTLADSNKVSVNQQTNLSNEEVESLQRQVTLLQDGVAARTPNQAVETWIKGVETRNGALQFAVMSKDLREKLRVSFEQLKWITGYSSPWIQKHEILNRNKLSENAWEYHIQFDMASSTGKAGTFVAQLTVKKYEDTWYVSNITSDTDHRLFP